MFCYDTVDCCLSLISPRLIIFVRDFRRPYKKEGLISERPITGIKKSASKQAIAVQIHSPFIGF